MADEQLSSWAKQKWFDDYDLNEVKLKAMIDQFLELQRVTKGLEVNLKGADTLKDVITSQNALVDANGRLVSSFGEVSKTLAQGAAAKDRYNGSTDVVIKTSEKLIRLQGEEAKAQQQINKALQEGEKVRILSGKATLEQAKAETEAAKTKLANLRADQAAEKQARVSVKSNQDLTNEYGLLSKAYNEAALKAKNYSLTLGANNPVTKQATADALAMGQKLKELDASVGQNQRNVGNYSSVLTGYANTLRGLRGPTKLLGEALGVGAQAADQLRLVIEHSIQGLAAYFRTKEAKAATETADATATAGATVSAEANTAAVVEQTAAAEVNTAVLRTNVTIKQSGVLATQAQVVQGRTYTISLAQNTVAAEANTVATGESAVATEGLATAQVAATGASKALRIALLASGITIVLALVAVAVVAYLKWKDSIQEARLAHEAFGKALDSTDYKGAIQNVAELTENIKLAKQGFLDKNVVIEQYNKSIGEAAGKVSDLDGVEQGVVAHKDAYVQMMLYKAAAVEAYKQSAENAVKAQKALNDVGETPGIVDQAVGAVGGINPIFYSTRKQLDEAEKAKKEADKLIKVGNDFRALMAKTAKDNGLDAGLGGNIQPGSVAALRQQKSTLKEKIDAEKAGSAAQIEDTKKLIALEKELKAIEGHPDKTGRNQIPNDFSSEVIAAQKKAIEEQSKNRAAGLKDDEAAFKAIADDESKSLGDRLFAYSQYIQKKKELVREEKDSQIKEAQNTIAQLNAEVAKDNSLIAGSKLTASQKTSLQNKNNAIKEQVEALNESIKRLTTERTTEQKTIESEGQKGIAGIVKNGSENIVKIKRAEIDQIKADNEAAKNSDLADLRDRLNAGQVTYKDYKAEELAITERYALQEQQAVKARLTKDLEELKGSGLDTIQLQKDLNAVLKAIYDADAKAFDDAQKAKADAIKELHDKEKEFAKEALSAVKTLFDSNYQNQISQYDDLINKIKEKADAEISEAERQGLSEKDLAAKKTAIQARAASEQQRLSDEQRSIKKKQAEIDTAVSVAQILATALQTEFELSAKAAAASAQAALLASNPVTAAYAPVAAAAAATIRVEEGIVAGIAALQVAAVLASAPKFFKGTDSAPEGLAWIGEKGRELRINPDGSREFTPAVPTLDFLQAGTKIIPNHELMAMTRMYGIGLPMIHPQQAVDLSSLEKSLSQQTDRLAAVIANKKELHMNWDVYGWHFSVKEAQSRQNYIKKNIQW